MHNYLYPINFKTTKKMSRRLVVDIIVFSYVLLFVYAAVSKFLDYQLFTVQLAQSPMLTMYSSVIAWFIPVVELFIALLLVVPRTRLTGLYGGLFLMLMFTTYIILASRFSDYVPCSCGGILGEMGWTAHLSFNVIFVALGIIAILIQPQTPVKKTAMASTSGAFENI